jgi:hypothetical protein
MLWKNKKIDPTGENVKIRTFSKIIINIGEVSLFFVFLSY